MSKDTIIDKLRKVLALAKRGGTEAEAAAAMATAQRLLAQHNLSMDDIKDTPEESVTEEKTYTGRKMNWKDAVYTSISRLCFCMALKGHDSIIIIGKPTDIITARLLAQYVIETGERLIEREPTDRRYRNSWRVGFARRISQRVHELIRQAKEQGIKEESTGRDLIIHPMYERALTVNNNFAVSKYGNIQSSRTRTTVSSRDGYQAGSEAANSVPLARNTIETGVNTSRGKLTA